MKYKYKIGDMVYCYHDERPYVVSDYVSANEGGKTAYRARRLDDPAYVMWSIQRYMRKLNGMERMIARIKVILK